MKVLTEIDGVEVKPYRDDSTDYYISKKGQLYSYKSGRPHLMSVTKDTAVPRRLLNGTYYNLANLVLERFTGQPEALWFKDGNRRNITLENLSGVLPKHLEGYDMLHGEVAYQVPYIPTVYVTMTGKVFSLVRRVIQQLVTFPTQFGYLCVGLANVMGRKYKQEFVHRLVAITFLGEPTGDAKFVNHKDNDKTNNNLYNLEFVTTRANMCHSFKLANGVVNARVVKNKDKIRYMSTIAYAGKAIYLGTFDTKEEARGAYKKKAMELGVTHQYMD